TLPSAAFKSARQLRAGRFYFNRTVSRAKLEKILGEQPACIVEMEACATSHFWGRFAQNLGHDVRLFPLISGSGHRDQVQDNLARELSAQSVEIAILLERRDDNGRRHQTISTRSPGDRDGGERDRLRSRHSHKGGLDPPTPPEVKALLANIAQAPAAELV